MVLVSSDLRRPEVEAARPRQGPGLAEALQDEPIPAIAMLVSINDHLLVLPAGMPSKHPGELLASTRLLETIQALRQMGIVILDTPPATHSADAITLSSVADATLFVAKSGATRMRSVRNSSTASPRPHPPARDDPRRDQEPVAPLAGARGGDLRDSADAELEDLEPMPPRTVPFNPRPPSSVQEPAAENGEQASEVTGLKAAERNRRAAE